MAFFERLPALSWLAVLSVVSVCGAAHAQVLAQAQPEAPAKSLPPTVMTELAIMECAIRSSDLQPVRTEVELLVQALNERWAVLAKEKERLQAAIQHMAGMDAAARVAHGRDVYMLNDGLAKTRKLQARYEGLSGHHRAMRGEFLAQCSNGSVLDRELMLKACDVTGNNPWCEAMGYMLEPRK